MNLWKPKCHKSPPRQRTEMLTIVNLNNAEILIAPLLRLCLRFMKTQWYKPSSKFLPTNYILSNWTKPKHTRFLLNTLFNFIPSPRSSKLFPSFKFPNNNFACTTFPTRSTCPTNFNPFHLRKDLYFYGTDNSQRSAQLVNKISTLVRFWRTKDTNLMRSAEQNNHEYK